MQILEFQSPALYKAELLQLNRTQFPFLEFFVCIKVGNPNNYITPLITSVLKVEYWVVLVFSFPTFLLIKISQGRKSSAKKIPTCGNSDLNVVKCVSLTLW